MRLEMEFLYLRLVANRKDYDCSKSLSLAIFAATFILCFATCQAIAAQTSWQKHMIAGVANLNKQNLPISEKCFRQAVQEVDFVSHTPEDKVKCLNALANALALENKTDQSEIFYQKALDILERSYGSSSQKLLPDLLALGSIYESVGNHKAAMLYYNKTIAINEKHYGPYSPEFAYHFLPADSIGNNKGYSEKFKSDLWEQAGLSASKALENCLPSYKKDMLETEDSSNQDLISDFQSDIAKTPAPKVAPGEIAASPNQLKQQNIEKRSDRM